MDVVVVIVLLVFGLAITVAGADLTLSTPITLIVLL